MYSFSFSVNSGSTGIAIVLLDRYSALDKLPSLYPKFLYTFCRCKGTG